MTAPDGPPPTPAQQAAASGHPLAREIVEMAEHMRKCFRCRLGFARVLYENPDLEFDADQSR